MIIKSYQCGLNDKQIHSFYIKICQITLNSIKLCQILLSLAQISNSPILLYLSETSTCSVTTSLQNPVNNYIRGWASRRSHFRIRGPIPSPTHIVIYPFLPPLLPTEFCWYEITMRCVATGVLVHAAHQTLLAQLIRDAQLFHNGIDFGQNWTVERIIVQWHWRL